MAVFDGVVTTRYGKVRGVESDGCWAFKGIAYASPPTGANRFQPPCPPASWRGIRSADEFGPIAPQATSVLGSYLPGDPTNQDEDCLTLNVWTPGDGGPHPVMVFIHGGAYLIGSSAQVIYHGEHLARRGVVLVTFNYRIGALGYLADPALANGDGGFGNWGLHDQLAVLSWVRDNIAEFEGDSGNVTIFGESAGAMSVADLLGIPRARGLFRRAIVQSGAPYASYPEPAIATARQFAKELGLPRLERHVLEEVPAEEILGAQLRVSDTIDGGLGMPFRPVVDGGLMVRHPADEIAAGSAADIDLLVGTNRDEFRFFSITMPELQEVDEVVLSEIVGRYMAGAGLDEVDPDEVIATYRAAHELHGEAISARALLDVIVTDWIFRIPQLRLAQAHRRHCANVYAYLFDWESPFANGALGACHALELPFVFGTIDNPVIAMFAGASAEALALSAQIMGAWTSFAATGVPLLGADERWPRYDVERRSTVRFGPTTHIEDAPYESEREFWDARLGRYGEHGPIEGSAPPTMALIARQAADRAGT